MILDALGLLSDAQALTATGVSTNTIDLGNTTPKRQVGDGRPLALTITFDVGADFTTADETYDFQLIQSAADTLTTPTILARRTYIATGSFISSLLVTGYIIVLTLPPGLPLQRYIGVNYVLAGTTPTMTVSAFFGPLFSVGVKPQTYAKNYQISG